MRCARGGHTTINDTGREVAGEPDGIGWDKKKKTKRKRVITEPREENRSERPAKSGPYPRSSESEHIFWGVLSCLVYKHHA